MDSEKDKNEFNNRIKNGRWMDLQIDYFKWGLISFWLYGFKINNRCLLKKCLTHILVANKYQMHRKQESPVRFLFFHKINWFRNNFSIRAKTRKSSQIAMTITMKTVSIIKIFQLFINPVNRIPIHHSLPIPLLPTLPTIWNRISLATTPTLPLLKTYLLTLSINLPSQVRLLSSGIIYQS